MELLNGTGMVRFSDDVVLIVTVTEEEVLMSLANTTILRIIAAMKATEPESVPKKSETILLITRWNSAVIEFEIQSQRIFSGTKTKYLGVWWATISTFASHDKPLVMRTEKKHEDQFLGFSIFDA